MFVLFSVTIGEIPLVDVAWPVSLRGIGQQWEASPSYKAMTATSDFCRACWKNSKTVQLFWRWSDSLPGIIANMKIDRVKKFAAAVVPCHGLHYNQEVRWNHRLVKIFVYNKHVVESAQLVKIWMNFYGVSPKCWVTCSLMTRIIASWKISTLILVCQVFTLRTEIRKKN